ncbi:MAG: AAA family ATPase [Thermoanaerobaculia bacterium]|nr:AAA family ATPase [Thermoanaerobaculia bacterium]
MKELSALRIYLTNSVHDTEEARTVYEQLGDAGFDPFWAEEDIPLGEEHLSASLKAAEEADVILICFSAKSGEDHFFDMEAGQVWIKGKLTIPVYLDPPRYFGITDTFKSAQFIKTRHGIHYYLPNGLQKLIRHLTQLAETLPAERGKATEASGGRVRRGSLLVKKLTLSNIRCLEDLELDLGVDPGPLTVILGDNAAGKTTLLRCLALGLCSESDASFLFKQVPGAFIREGAEEGIIHIELRDPEKEQDLSITTRITKSATDETIRKETTPDPFPWEDLFICAYGTNRSQQAKAGHDVYNLHEALRPLFDDTVTLKNPELVLLREEPHLRVQLERRLLGILMLDEPEHRLDYRRTGAYLHGPWGDQPINTLSDGYRSTAQWVIDFLGWAIYAGRINGKGEAGGILIVDEVEQHLHPLWQRHMLQRLHHQLPTTQIFVSTHTPLIVSGAVDVEGAHIVRLKMHENGSVEKVEIEPSSLAHKRADQVLASEAFGLLTSRNPGSADDFDRYAELLGKENRSNAEAEELQRLGKHLEESLALGETPLEREIGHAIDVVLKDRLANVNPDLLDIEVKRQLRDIFRHGDEE